MRLPRIFRRNPHKIVSATLEFPDDNSFRLYPFFKVVFANGNNYFMDIQAVYEKGIETGRKLELDEAIENEPMSRERYIYHLRNAQLAALDDLTTAILKPHEKPMNGEPSSFTNIAFDSGLLWERNRIIEIIEEQKSA